MINFTRDQLKKFLPDLLSIIQFEKLFSQVNDITTTVIDNNDVLVATADDKAAQALTEIEDLRDLINNLISQNSEAEKRIEELNDFIKSMPVDDLSWSQQLTDIEPRYVSISFGDSPYSVVNDYEVIIADATGGNITVNALSASVEGRKVWLKKIDSSANTVDLASSDNIDGAATFSLLLQYENVTALSTSGTYQVIP